MKDVRIMKAIDFKPALRFTWFTKMFDPFIKIMMPEKRIKNDLIKNEKVEINYGKKELKLL